MAGIRVGRVQGLRSSGAAGPHGTPPTRAAELVAALADYGIGPGDCIECGHPFDPAESTRPDTCRECVAFEEWFFDGTADGRGRRE